MAKIAHIFKLNKVIWLLTFSDIFSWGLFLSITSLVGIYLSNKLGYDALEVVGIGVGLSYLIRGVSQIPIGLVTDNIKKDRDDLLILITGSILMGLPFLFYPVIQSALAFYFLHGIFGFGAAMNLVTWRKLFAKNLDKGKEGFTYAVYDTIMSAAIALFSFVGGILASNSPAIFDLVLMGIGVAIMASSTLPALIFDVSDRKSV